MNSANGTSTRRHRQSIFGSSSFVVSIPLRLILFSLFLFFTFPSRVKSLALGLGVSVKENAIERFRRAYKIFSVKSEMLHIWDFSRHMTLYFLNEKNKVAKETQRQSEQEKTPKDKKASLVIHALVDKVIAGVMGLLNLRIPPFVRIDLFQIIFTQALSLDKRYVNWTLRVASVHGQNVPLPFISSVKVSFSEGRHMKEAFLHKQPLRLKRRTMEKAKSFDIFLRLNYSDGCGCSCTRIKIPVDFQVPVSRCVYDKDAVFQKLRDRTIQDLRCGKNAVLERKAVTNPKSEITVYAAATNIVVYDKTSKALEAASLSNGGPKRQNEGVNGIETSWKRRKARVSIK